MACGLSPAYCLTDHVVPALGGVKPLNASGEIRALCPAHGDRDPSLTLGVRNGRIVWHCFRKCPQETIRTAMIRAGVPPGCLPRPRRDPTAVLEEIVTLACKDMNPVEMRLRITELAAGISRKQAAELLGLSRASRFRYQCQSHRETKAQVRATPKKSHGETN